METPVPEVGKRLTCLAFDGRSVTLKPELYIQVAQRLCEDGITEVDARTIGRHGGRSRLRALCRPQAEWPPLQLTHPRFG